MAVEINASEKYTASGHYDPGRRLPWQRVARWFVAECEARKHDSNRSDWGTVDGLALEETAKRVAAKIGPIGALRRIIRADDHSKSNGWACLIFHLFLCELIIEARGSIQEEGAARE